MYMYSPGYSLTITWTESQGKYMYIVHVQVHLYECTCMYKKVVLRSMALGGTEKCTFKRSSELTQGFTIARR